MEILQIKGTYIEKWAERSICLLSFGRYLLTPLDSPANPSPLEFISTTLAIQETWPKKKQDWKAETA